MPDLLDIYPPTDRPEVASTSNITAPNVRGRSINTNNPYSGSSSYSFNPPAETGNDLERLMKATDKSVMSTAWAKSELYTNPIINTPFVFTTRYLDPEIGFDATDKELEFKYGEKQGVVSRIVNRVAKTGATAAVAFGETVASTINFLTGTDNVDNEGITATNEWLERIDRDVLPNYETKYKHDNPILSYFNPLHFTTWLDNVGGVTQNLGYTIGAIGAAALMDIPVAAMTEGLGAVPLLARQSNKIFSSLGKLSRVLTASPESYKAYQMALQSGDDVLKALARANNVKSGTDAARFLASTALSAYGESIIEGNNTYRAVKETLQNQYLDEYGMYAGDANTSQKIEQNAKSAGQGAVPANFGFLFVSNMFGLGSLLRPAAAATRATERALAEEVAIKLNPSNINVFDVVSRPATKLQSLYKRMAAPTAIIKDNLREAAEEGYQYVVDDSLQNYYTKRFNSQGNNDANSLSESISRSMGRLFTETEGQESMILGFLGGAIQGGIKGRIDGSRGILKGAALAESIKNELNGTTVTSLFDTTRNEAVVSADIAFQMQEASKNGDVFKYKNLQHQQLFNFVSSGMKANKFDARIEQLEALKSLDRENFETLFNMSLDENNQKTVSEYVDNLITKAKDIKGNLEKVNNVYGSNPYSKKKTPTEHLAFEAYKDELGLALSEQQDHLRRVRQLRDELTTSLPAASYEPIINLTSELGIQETIEGFNKRIADLQATEDSIRDNDAFKRGMIQEREYLEEKISQIQDAVSNDRNYQKDFLGIINSLHNYFGNGNSLTGDTNVNYMDSLEIFNKSKDILALRDNTERIARYYQELSGTDGFKTFAQDFGRRIDAFVDRIRIDGEGRMRVMTDEELAAENTPEDPTVANPIDKEYVQGELGVDNLEDGEEKIDKEDKELIAKIIDPENGEEAENIRKGVTPVTKEMKDTAKARLRSEFTEPTTETSETPKSDKTRAREKKIKEEKGIVDATDEDTDINDIIADPKIKPAKTATTSAPTDTAGAAINNPVEEVNATPQEKYWNRFVFSPFKMFNRLLSLNYEDTKFKDNLHTTLFGGNLAALNNLRAEVAPSIKGKSDQQYAKVVYWVNQEKKEFPNLYRQGFGTDITVYAGDTPIGIMHPPSVLVFKRGDEYVSVENFLDATEYARITTNPANTFEQFKKDFAAYKEAYNGLTQGYDGTTAKPIASEDFKAAFAPVVSFGSLDKSTSASKSTQVGKLTYRGKGDAIFSFPTEYNEEKGTYERTSTPTLLNKAELSEDEQAQAMSYVADNLGKIKGLDVRYVYIMRMPDGKFSNVSTVVARPSDETAANLEDYLGALKAAVNNETKEPTKTINARLGDGIYIAHDRAKRKTYARFSVEKNGSIALNIYNKDLKVSKKLIFSPEEVNGAENFDAFLAIANEKINVAEQTNRYLKNLDLTLTPKSFKKNLSPDQEVDIAGLEKNLSLSVRPNVFVNAGVTLMPQAAGSRSEAAPIAESVTRTVATTRAGEVINPNSTWAQDNNNQFKITKVDKKGNIHGENVKTKQKSVWTPTMFRGMIEKGQMREVTPAPATVTTVKKEDGTYDVIANGKVVQTSVPAGGVAAAIENAEKPVGKITTEPAKAPEPFVVPAQAVAPKPTMATPAPVVNVVEQNINTVIAQLKAKGLLQTDC